MVPADSALGESSGYSALVATALLSWLFVLPPQIRGHASNPYVGIIVSLVLPVVLFTGLILLPIGIYLSKRQIRVGFTRTKFDRRAALWRIVWFFVVVSAVNILIGTQLTYRAVTYMETCNSAGPLAIRCTRN